MYIYLFLIKTFFVKYDPQYRKMHKTEPFIARILDIIIKFLLIFVGFFIYVNFFSLKHFEDDG